MSDLRTYERLALPHLARLRAFARRRAANAADADDLVQEALIRGWQRFEELRDPAAIRSWLYRILASLARDQRRVEKRRFELFPVTTLETRLEEAVGHAGPGPLDLLIERRDVEALLAALASLPEDFALAVELHDVDGFAYRDVADITGVPIGTVMSRISRGRRLLAARLIDDDARSARPRRRSSPS